MTYPFKIRLCKVFKTLVIIPVFFSLFQVNTLHAQKNPGRYFHSLGFAFYGDYFFGHNLGEVTFTDPQTGKSEVSKSQSTYDFVSIFSVKYEPRLNLKEFGHNQSISINMPLLLGFGAGDASVNATTPNGDNMVDAVPGFIKLSTPVFLQYNRRFGSTYHTDATKGFTVGLGLNIETPLLGLFAKANEDYYGEIKVAKFYYTPAITLGWRYKKPSGAAAEFNLKLGYSKVKGIDDMNVSPEFFEHNMVLAITFNRILGY